MSNENAARREYLGDSVYAEMSEGMIKLTTNNGLGASNTIYLEPETLRSFSEWAKSGPEWARVVFK